MPYTKLVTIYSRQERANLHRLGYWVDKQGNQLSVYEMGYYRLEKLVRTLGRWAMKESDPISYLINQPIYPHVRTQIKRLGLRNEYTRLFVGEVVSRIVVRVPVMVASENEEYWQDYMNEPSQSEIEQMNQSAEELRNDFTGA
jgi:hypothetical protein